MSIFFVFVVFLLFRQATDDEDARIGHYEDVLCGCGCFFASVYMVYWARSFIMNPFRLSPLMMRIN